MWHGYVYRDACKIERKDIRCKVVQGIFWNMIRKRNITIFLYPLVQYPYLQIWRCAEQFCTR